MSVALINPNQVVQANDPFTTGVVYMPLTLAYAAANLRKHQYNPIVIDAYGESPRQVNQDGSFWIFGLTPTQVIEKIPENADAIILYAINLTNHRAGLSLVQAIKKNRPNIPLIVLENTQAVTAYSLKYIAQEFYDQGVDFVCTGEGDERVVKIVQGLTSKKDASYFQSLDGVGSPNFYNPPKHHIDDLDALPFPAWDLFPVENYWNLRFAHGPQSTKRYLPLLTSRGCPYPCKFCVVPATNNQKWRSRSAVNVVDEIEYWVKEKGVHEFHIEDLDPTISDQRIKDIANEIIRRDLKIIWKIVAGTKIETIRTEETIDVMAQSGCQYISISPETGSARLLKEMRKPFNLDHAIRMTQRMNRRKIRSQACFVLGYPGETHEDRVLTSKMVHKLTRKGVDEIALFIVTPVPGSAIYDEFSGYDSLSQLNFSPTWRQDYKELNKFRLGLYRKFLFWKLAYHPIKFVRQIFLFLRRHFETKMEMVPYRAFCFKWWARSLN